MIIKTKFNISDKVLFGKVEGIIDSILIDKGGYSYSIRYSHRGTEGISSFWTEEDLTLLNEECEYVVPIIL